MKGRRFYAKDTGPYIGVYTSRSCKYLWGVFWKDRPYYDKCYFGKRLICTPGYEPIKVEWV